MLTFQDQYTLAQQISKDYSAAQLVAFKRDINEGGVIFLGRLGRKFVTEYSTTNIEQGEQYYQMPSSVLRVSEIKCKNGSNYYTPELVGSELEWNRITSINNTGNVPTHYFIRGNNEVGLYPIPSTDVTDGMVVSYEPRHVALSQADTTGTATFTNGQEEVTGTGFTQNMVGRYITTTDGSDGRWYRIGGFTSATVLTLENFYEGIGGSHTYRMGEVMKVPEGYQDAPVYHALEKWALTEASPKEAIEYAARFKAQLREAKKTFARSTSRYGVRTAASGNRGSRGWIDQTNPVTYP